MVGQPKPSFGIQSDMLPHSGLSIPTSFPILRFSSMVTEVPRECWFPGPACLVPST